MDANDYQKLAGKYFSEEERHPISDNDLMIVWNALGLAGEAGEVANLAKKGVLHRHGLDKAQLKTELGDVMWYLAALCTYLELDLSEVMQANLDKLKMRYPQGFNFEDSLKKADLE